MKKIYNCIIALSGPYGSGCSSLSEELVKIINDWPGCYCKKIQVSKIIQFWHDQILGSEFEISDNSDHRRRKNLQKIGNSLREEKKDIIGELVAQEILYDSRKIEDCEDINNIGTLVYIVDSLKNVNDYLSLKSIYKDELFFCFVTANNEIRWRRMRDYKSWDEKDKANFQEIDLIDSDEKISDPSVQNNGQQVKKLSPYADYYIVNNKTREDLKSTAYRMVSLLFGLTINQPTKDEKSMHIAFSSANQSACLSRQVGAAIFTKEGNILSIGHNDVPKAGGGLYSIEDEKLDHRCLNVGDRRCINDTNKEERFVKLTHDIKKNLIDYFKNKLDEEKYNQILDFFNDDSEKSIVKSIYSSVKNSEFKDATEYCRAVHAEMDALLSVCRNLSGSTIGATVYVTTQPCHNCVKHIITAGIDRVVYIEPYPKSLGEELHSDAITLNPQSDATFLGKVSFMPYQGLAPRRYHDIFDMNQKRKENDGKMCYRTKNMVAIEPKFSQHVEKRSRLLDKDNPIRDLITLNEMTAAENIGKLLKNTDEEENYEKDGHAGQRPTAE